MAESDSGAGRRGGLYCRIIAAAHKCIRRKRGRLHDLHLTKAEVSREAGVAPGSINHYFGTVEGMTLAAINEGRQLGDPVIEAYAVLVGGEGDMSDAVTYWSRSV